WCGVLDCLFGGAHGEASIYPARVPLLGVRVPAAQVEVLHLGGERGGEMAGVEGADPIDAAAAVNLSVVQVRDRVAHRRHRAHARNHDSAAVAPDLAPG